MAAYKIGCVVLPLFVLFGEDALRYRLKDSGAAAVVTDADNLPKVLALKPGLQDLREIYSLDPAEAPVRFMADEIAKGGTITRLDTKAEDPAVLIYTSGTTGDPKGVLHAQRFLIGHLPSIETTHIGFGEAGDIGWTPADWAWIGGLMDMAMVSLYYGVPLVSQRMRKFDAEAAFRLIRDEKITRLFLPPTALKLMRQADVPKGLGIKSITSGGESLGADMLNWGQAALGAPINEIYGQTECNICVGTSAGLMDVRPGAMGKPTPGHRLAVIDSDGAEVPRGTPGEIAIKAPDPIMFLRYWNKPEKTAERFAGDWMRTGDLGIMDEDGYLSFVARDDDVITSAGYRIGPTEIENCLTGHPDVVMAAVIGVPDDLRTEIVKAVIVLREGAEWDGLPEALIQRVKDRVSPHVAPRIVERADSLPMTATGKIMRRALK